MASDSDSDGKMKYHVPVLTTSSDVNERDFIRNLIALYKEHPVLWDTNDTDYTNKNRRAQALKYICDCLKVYRPDYTVDELKKKMNILRTNYNKQRNKLKLIEPLSDEKPEPALWYYNEISFIAERNERQTSVKTINENSFPTISPKNEATKKRILQNLKRNKISIVSDPLSMRKLECEEDILAKCWARKLKKLSPDQKLYAEKIINDTLFEAEMGTLTRYGATFNNKPSNWSESSSPSGSPIS